MGMGNFLNDADLLFGKYYFCMIPYQFCPMLGCLSAPIFTALSSEAINLLV